MKGRKGAGVEEEEAPVNVGFPAAVPARLNPSESHRSERHPDYAAEVEGPVPAWHEAPTVMHSAKAPPFIPHEALHASTPVAPAWQNPFVDAQPCRG